MTTLKWNRHWRENGVTHIYPLYRELEPGKQPRLEYWWSTRKSPNDKREKPLKFDPDNRLLFKLVEE